MPCVQFLVNFFNKQRNGIGISAKLILLLCVSFWAFAIYFVVWNSVYCDEDFAGFGVSTSTPQYNKYLIYNNKCKIPDFKIWHNEAQADYKLMQLPPSKIPLLVNMHRNLNKVFLHLNKSATTWEIDRCTACLVQRDNNSAIPDNKIQLYDCKHFDDITEMRAPIVDVKCYRKNDPNLTVYQQVFANYVWPDRPKCLPKQLEAYNLIILGIDSVSNLSFKRLLPSTYEYLAANDWTEFVGFNKIRENTLPILFGLLTGEEVPSGHHFYDDYHFIWEDYRNAGYVTSFIEDFVTINTFNLRGYGFKTEPTVFYFRPYVVAYSTLPAENKEMPNFRFGGQITANRILDLVKELPFACKEQPYFGFFWMNTFSHYYSNAPQLLDGNITTFLKDLKQQSNFDNTIIIFMADHGCRFGGIRATVSGWYEDLLPFLFIHLPETFKKRHPQEYQNFLLNSKRLTSAYDLYVTLQDVLVLSNLNKTLTMPRACPTCNSIFRAMPEERSCSEAGIIENYCTCNTWYNVDRDSNLARLLARCVVEETQKILDSYGHEADGCQKWNFSRVLHIRSSSESNNENITTFIVALETIPSAGLEAYINVNISEIGVNCRLVASPERLDPYKTTGYCVDKRELQKYCYCK